MSRPETLRTYEAGDPIPASQLNKIKDHINEIYDEIDNINLELSEASDGGNLSEKLLAILTSAQEYTDTKLTDIIALDRDISDIRTAVNTTIPNNISSAESRANNYTNSKIGTLASGATVSGLISNINSDITDIKKTIGTVEDENVNSLIEQIEDIQSDISTISGSIGLTDEPGVSNIVEAAINNAIQDEIDYFSRGYLQLVADTSAGTKYFPGTSIELDGNWRLYSAPVRYGTYLIFNNFNVNAYESESTSLYA